MSAARALSAIAIAPATVVGVGPAAPAAADEPLMCHGKPATLVGDPSQEELVGTDGDDVIVTHGSGTVRGGPGDDTICIDQVPAGTYPYVYAYDGGGDDYLESSFDPAIPNGTAIYRMSPGGHDSIVGGEGQDLVDADRPSGDAYDLGGGGDHVSGDLTGAVIRLGDGDDSVDPLVDGRARLPEVLDGGPGLNYVGIRELTTTARTAVVDNTDQILSLDGKIVSSWESFQGFSLSSTKTRMVFLGSPAAERVIIGVISKAPTRLNLRGGDDSLLYLQPSTPIIGAIRGGAGNDTIQVGRRWQDKGATVVDLAHQRVRYLTAKGALDAAFTLDDFESTRVDATTIRITGTADPNTLRAFGCDQVVNAGDGDDQVFLGSAEEDSFGPLCPVPLRSEAHGNSGNDTLTAYSYGNDYDDVLHGGPGTDSADGGDGGHDECRAETVVNCEE